jgi:dsRNA-specific ribonuclease
MSKEKIKKLFNDLSAEEQSVVLLELNKSKKKAELDTSIISAFASRHQKEYQKDIRFTVYKASDDDSILVTMHTTFGDFRGVGSNQKIAKINAVKKANEAWDG